MVLGEEREIDLTLDFGCGYGGLRVWERTRDGGEYVKSAVVTSASFSS